MGFQANVLKVFIASPGDAFEERNQVEQVIHEWNNLNSERENVMLLPIRWEKSLSPEYSIEEDGQEIINKRILQDSDIVIVLIKSKLGTPTSRTESGTLEEVDIFSKQNASRIGIFFVPIPAPTNTVGLTEYQRVISFREKLEKEKHGVYGYYEQKKIESFLTRQVAQYTFKLEIEKEKSTIGNEDNSSHIINNIERRNLQPDEVLLLNFMYTEGYNKIDISTSFKYETYLSFLKSNNYKDKYINLLERTCDKLCDRNILEFLDVQEFINPYNYDIEEIPSYKLNIKTFDQLGNILINHESYIIEKLTLCEIETNNYDLPF